MGLNEAIEESTETAQHLPRADDAADLISIMVEKLPINMNDIADEDYQDYEHRTIARIEPGKIWFAGYDTGKAKEIGPIKVPKSATEILDEGWDVGCALGRIRGKWEITEGVSVYPY